MAFSKIQRRKLIASLIANEVMDEDSREYLNELTDNQLVALASPDKLDKLVDSSLAVNEEPTDEDYEEVTDDEDDYYEETTTNMGKDKKTLETYSDDELMAEMDRRKGKKGKKGGVTGNSARAGNPAEEAQAIEEYLQRTNAPEVVKRLIANQVAADEEARVKYIDSITANESAEWSEDELAAMSTPELARIARLCDNAEDSDYVAASDWSGATGSFSLGGNQQTNEEPLGVTEWDYDFDYGKED